MKDKYIPLYRKYRPQSLNEIVGQEHIKKSLANAIELNRISHAYLFTGPRGTGKTSTARIFAKSLNCKKGPTVNPCGVCENCTDITNSTPMDVIEIDAASNRKVEDAQNILEKVMYAPVNSKYKIYIIDEVHMLSPTAFNALLKTLEEPPENVIFILATTEVHKVLDTIKSRCQRFDFKRITNNDIVKHLRYIADNEKINITDEALGLIAKNSAGGMRDSIALLDQLSILGSKEAITVDDINNLLGRLSFDTLSMLADCIINSDCKKALEEINKIYNKGNEPVQILTNLIDYLKNLLVVKNSSDDIAFEVTGLNELQIKKLKEQAEKLETHQIVSLTEKCSDHIKEIKSTNNPSLWLEVAIIDLADLTENTTLMDLQNRIAKLEAGQVSSESVHTFRQPVRKAVYTPQNIVTDKSESVSNNTVENNVNSFEKSDFPAENEKPVEKEQEFSPMPKSKSQENIDISVLWGQLLSNIQSAPTRALLKQWASPVIISPEDTVLTIKNEIFLNKVQASKQTILDAVNALFSQSDSKVTVRLPQKDDEQPSIKNVNIPEPQNNTPAAETVPQPDESEDEQEDIEDVREDLKENTKAEENLSENNTHSDNVNNMLDLFDGKIIE